MPTVAQQDSMWFGAGYIFGTQSIAPGGILTPPSILLPSQVVTIQEAHVDFAIKTVELRSALEDPEDVATASRKVSGKVTTGRVNLEQLNWLVFGEPGGGNYVTGTTLFVNREPHVIPTGLTVTVTNGATFFEDKGVFITGTRLQMVPLASGPVNQGQYTYNPATGVYTFNTSDAGLTVGISYRYTSTSGHTLTINNLVMGSARPAFEALFTNQYDGDNELLLFQCRVNKIGFPIKTEDYVKMDIEFIAYANVAGQSFQWLSSK